MRAEAVAESRQHFEGHFGLLFTRRGEEVRALWDERVRVPLGKLHGYVTFGVDGRREGSDRVC